MKRTLAVAMLTALVSSSAFASTHHRRHDPDAIARLEGEIAALTRKIDRLARPAGWQTPVAIPFQAVASLGEAATQAAIEVPQTVIVKPLAEISESISLAADRAYLVATSCPGYTMHRQGVALSIARLHPVFVHRLAAAFRDSRRNGVNAPCIFSAYRPPGYGVGGFRDKFDSAHAYGLATDLGGIRRHYGQWLKIAASHGLYRPYASAVEWNHFQPTPVHMVTYAAKGLRRTITARGPVELQRMWKVADAIIPGPGKHVVIPRDVRVPRARRYHHYALKHRHHRYLSHSTPNVWRVSAVTQPSWHGR